jgi:hypothetical protein
MSIGLPPSRATRVPDHLKRRRGAQKSLTDITLRSLRIRRETGLRLFAGSSPESDRLWE